MIEIIDGGSRESIPVKTRAIIAKKKEQAYKRSSYDTEGVLRAKYDKSFKNGQVKRTFSCGVSFDKDGKIIREVEDG